MISVDVQHASLTPCPSQKLFQQWVSACIVEACKDTEVCIRLVDRDEIQLLNRQYRNKDKPTNVLSFPCETPAEIDISLLGDIVICTDIVLAEAKIQGKTPEAHWAHMVVHGTLHLLGYDHGDDSEANKMEKLETNILTSMGYPAPYPFETEHN